MNIFFMHFLSIVHLLFKIMFAFFSVLDFLRANLHRKVENLKRRQEGSTPIFEFQISNERDECK